jgi:hypothetical protein
MAGNRHSAGAQDVPMSGGGVANNATHLPVCAARRAPRA